VVVLTLVLLVSGVALLLAGQSWLPLLLKVHKASFLMWFGAMTIHVLGHLGEVFRLAPRDWLRRARREVTGAGSRQWLIAASLVAGPCSGFSRSATWGTGWRWHPQAETTPQGEHGDGGQHYGRLPGVGPGRRGQVAQAGRGDVSRRS
jgi:hypothetical protein